MKMITLAFAAYLIFLPSPLPGQTSPIPRHSERWTLDSGVHSGDSKGTSSSSLVFSGVMHIAYAPWFRIRFAEAYLDGNSYITVRSLKDGAEQRLNALSLLQWQNTSAYFNGDAAEIQLFVDKNDRDVFFRIEEVTVGDWMPGDSPESQCGPSDDRVPSGNPAVGRLLDIGCTAWIICNGRIVTAGHCVSTPSCLDVLEFNVPLSMPNGTIVHPGPEDQYAINTTIRSFVEGGVGNDWGVFEVFPNSVTGLMPIDAQAAHFDLAQNLDPVKLRITGFGRDFNENELNKTQQTHVGPNVGSSETTMRYQTDTESGNSGSPVIDEATGLAVGVHTHSGCTIAGGNNSGTSTFNADFWTAVNSGLCNGVGGIPCSDVSSFRARCGLRGTIHSRVVLVSNAHDGESVEFVVDGTDNYSTTIIENRAVLSVEGYSSGPHIVALTNPAGCFEPIVATCTESATDEDEGFSKDDAQAAHSRSEVTSLSNYPNPFNPSTAISYQLSADSWVALRVYNTLGEEVATLVNEFQTAGKKSVVWNGRDDTGLSVASGMYLYRLTNGIVVQSGKMMYMK